MDDRIMPNLHENLRPEYYGYKVRKSLYPGEDEYFKKNRKVAGMAAEDNQIVLNPYAEGVNLDAVAKNEAARLWMRENKVTPGFLVTPEQKTSFAGTVYENDPAAMAQTILGRIVSGDPSAGNITPEQLQWANTIMQQMIGNR